MKGLPVLVLAMACCSARAQLPAGGLPEGAWTKLSPLPGGPTSPRLGYEGACAWDLEHEVLLRYGGHNQGGGGEQHSEIWAFSPGSGTWQLVEPNTAPPGICCGQQNVYDPLRRRYLRFPAFSGSHGWQWFREIYLNNSSLWTYDHGVKRWTDLRPLPAPHVRGLRCASWDSDRSFVLVFGGENSREGTWSYDPWRNEWTKRKTKRQPEFRSGGNMVYDPGIRKHVLFGAQFSVDPCTWSFDPDTDTWEAHACGDGPPGDHNDAVLAFDPTVGKALALVKISTGEKDQQTHRVETWSLDTKQWKWTKLNPDPGPDHSGNRTRQLMWAPQLGAILLENCVKPKGGEREQQIWAWRFPGSKPGVIPDKPPALPGIVDDLHVSVKAANHVALNWSAREDAREYIVERAPVTVWSEDQLERLKSVTPPLSSPSVGAIRAVGAFLRIGVSKTSGYADRSIDLGDPTTVDKAIWEKGLHKDHLDAKGQAYSRGVHAYRVRVKGTDGTSGPSPAVFTLPAAPEYVFAREDGQQARVKWNALPGAAGYRVYRMNGRWKKDPILRLTPDPITETTFTDPQAGTSSRRYYVVAVDAIGQEGFPSAPAWFQREWKRFYLPFTKDWHQ